jgi:hypothetical protein
MGENILNRPENWATLTADQKRDARFNWQMEAVANIKFVSPEAEKRYRHKLQRMLDAYKVQEPDRVPVSLNLGAVPYFSYGIDYYTAIYEYEKAVQAYAKFNPEHVLELDNFFVPSNLIPAKAFDILDLKFYSWPGHGMPKTAVGFQFIESEYMKANEYDAFILNPSDFWMRNFMPRIFGAFEPFKTLGPFTELVEVPTPQLMYLANPEIQDVLRKLLEVGQEMANYRKVTGEYTRKVQANGYPVFSRGEFAKAPFDTIGDTLRGTQGVMKDMYRQPDKLLKALDIVADLTINQVLSSPAISKSLKVWFPLHKGADGWMSQKQFETFYWPSLKKVMDAFINDGYQVSMFAEGSFNTRLDSVTDFPKGSVHWHFDRTDMVKAKQVLGGRFSIEGNVPTSLIVAGSPQDVKEYCRKLIETCAPGGGYVLNAGASSDTPKIENLKAMVDAAKEFGVYKH